MTVVGVGVDVVDVPRFRTVIARRPGVADRLFTDAERAYGERAGDGAVRLAARFAAKEAVMKALGVGVGAFAFREVEVVREESGAPVLELHGAAADLARERAVTAWHLSLSHSDSTAVAFVVAETTRAYSR